MRVLPPGDHRLDVGKHGVPSGCQVDVDDQESQHQEGADRVHGGNLLKIDLSEPTAIGGKRGWKATLPILQWSVSP